MNHRAIGLATLMGLLGGGCAHAPAEPVLPAVCEQAIYGAKQAEPSQARLLTLLLRGMDPATRRLTVPALDCTGTQIRWDGPALACEDATTTTTQLPEQPVGMNEVVTTPAGEGRLLAWVPTARFASGDAVGPVALVEVRPERLRAVALGTLRIFPERVRLRLEAAGGRQVLVAEGEVCPTTGPGGCRRSARLLRLEGSSFEEFTLSDEQGRCLSPALLDISRSEQHRAEPGWQRTTLSASFNLGSAGIAVEEQVVVETMDKPDGTGAMVLRRAQQARTLRWAEGGAVGSEPSLWARLKGAP